MSLHVPRQFQFIPVLSALVAAFCVTPVTKADVSDLNETVVAGQSVTFGVTADGTPAPTFQWIKDGLPIKGATTNRFTIASASATNNGVYNVVATNSAGWAMSNDLILTVSSASSAIAGMAPSFTLQPYPSASAPAGSSITLSASAVGTPAPEYQWHKNGVPVTGATNSSLTLPSLTTNDSATYSVVAKNSAGVASSGNSVLTVIAATASTTAPVWVLHPLSQTVRLKGTISLKAAANGTPAPAYQWYKNGAAIAGATNASYTVIGANYTHSGTYTVVASNSAGSVTSKGVVVTVTQ